MSRHASLVDHLETEWTLHAKQGGQHRVLQVFLVSGCMRNRRLLRRLLNLHAGQLLLHSAQHRSA